MTASMHDSKSTWVDPDDAPELTDAFFDKATPKIDGKPVSKDRVRTAFKARRGRPPISEIGLPVASRRLYNRMDSFTYIRDVAA